jgi:hypothetical protein
MVTRVKIEQVWRRERRTQRPIKDGLVATYDLGVLFLLGTIRPQHGFSLVNSHTSPLDDLEVFQSGYNLAFDPGDQLDIGSGPVSSREGNSNRVLDAFFDRD